MKNVDIITAGEKTHGYWVLIDHMTVISVGRHIEEVD